MIQAKDSGTEDSFAPEDEAQEIELIPQNEPQEETIVTKAEEIFGSDIVTIVDD